MLHKPIDRALCKLSELKEIIAVDIFGYIYYLGYIDVVKKVLFETRFENNANEFDFINWS